MTSIGSAYAGALSERGERYIAHLDAQAREREAYREARLREIAADPRQAPLIDMETLIHRRELKRDAIRRYRAKVAQRRGR
jgi:hypothetical protein